MVSSGRSRRAACPGYVQGERFTAWPVQPIRSCASEVGLRISLAVLPTGRWYLNAKSSARARLDHRALRSRAPIRCCWTARGRWWWSLPLRIRGGVTPEQLGGRRDARFVMLGGPAARWCLPGATNLPNRAERQRETEARGQSSFRARASVAEPRQDLRAAHERSVDLGRRNRRYCRRGCV
jgi:hypothetical protein